MINAPALLGDLKRLTTLLEADIRERIEASPGLEESLTAEWRAAREAARTAQTLHDFREEVITQAAVHWLLMGVFVRFLEDNDLVDKPYLSGAEPERRALALDRHETYFRAHPGKSDREYLLDCFREVEHLPGMAALFDERHNPLWRLPVSGDGAMALLGFWRKVDPETGRVVHDFTDPEWDTRFLGDLYQDLSEAAQKRYALLQTPEFVEEFILDRTLEPALREFGYREVRLIDPTCGSGHFLLGAFRRLLDQWQRNEPGRNARDAVQKALDGVYGVDLNPFAVAIARFRLLVAALRAAGEEHLAEAPNFRFNLAAGDSLLHGSHKQADLFMGAEHYADTRLAHAYAVEDLDELNRILGQRYHAVVGNPPYITVKDSALNKSYRDYYSTCHMKYSLGVPFTERFFGLALSPDSSPNGSPHPNPSPPGERGFNSLTPGGESSGNFSSPRREGSVNSPSPPRGEGRGEGFKTRATAELNPILIQFAREMRHAPTDAEGRLWYFLRNRRMAGHKFRRQHSIGPYIVDFVCVDARLAIEIDGGQHGESEAIRSDQARDRFLRERGLEVLRFWNHEVLGRTEAVLEKIWLALENPSPPAPLPEGRGEGEGYAGVMTKVGAATALSSFTLGERGWGEGAGYVGMITANSFMKREFGKKLIEAFLPTVDLTHVIDTSGAYIPGHGTPTVILFGRNRQPVISSVRTVMGIKGEPVAPSNPAQGLVWSAIMGQVDEAGSQSEFVSVADTSRDTFKKHPWSIGGGGAADLKEMVEDGKKRLSGIIKNIGFSCITGEDDVFVMPSDLPRRYEFCSRQFGVGDEVRDWNHLSDSVTIFPYEIIKESFFALSAKPNSWQEQHLWRYKTKLRNRLMFGKTPEMAGFAWWELSFISPERLLSPLIITFAFVATHNHFVLDRGGKVFKQSAPVIKLPAESSEEDHLALMGLLNSSISCFWLKQVCQDKGNGGIGGGISDEKWELRYEFTGTKLEEFPLPETFPTDLARRLDQLAQERAACLPAALLAEDV